MTEQSTDDRIGLKTQGRKRCRVIIQDTVYKELQLESIRSGVPIYQLAHLAFINYLEAKNFKFS
jgi:hypothetical protein